MNKPSAVTKPTIGPPFSYALGIMVEATIAKIPPAAKALTTAWTCTELSPIYLKVGEKILNLQKHIYDFKSRDKNNCIL